MDIFEDFGVNATGSVLEVRHPATGLPLVMDGKNPVKINLVGMDSEQYRAEVRSRTNKRLKVSSENGKLHMTAEMLESEGIDLLVTCTLGWTGIYAKGEALVFSPENARELYTKLPWLREQVDKFIADRANFLRASAAS